MSFSHHISNSLLSVGLSNMHTLELFRPSKIECIEGKIFNSDGSVLLIFMAIIIYINFYIIPTGSLIECLIPRNFQAIQI